MNIIDWVRFKLKLNDNVESKEIGCNTSKYNTNNIKNREVLNFSIEGIDDYKEIYSGDNLELYNKYYSIRIFTNDKNSTYCFIWSDIDQFICARIPFDFGNFNIGDEDKLMYTNIASILNAIHDPNKNFGVRLMNGKIPEWNSNRSGIIVMLKRGFDSNVPDNDTPGTEPIRFKYDDYGINSGTIIPIGNDVWTKDRSMVLEKYDVDKDKTDLYRFDLKIAYKTGRIFSFKYSSSDDVSKSSNLFEVDAKAPENGILRIYILTSDRKTYRMCIMDPYRKIHYTYIDNSSIVGIKYEFK